MKIKAVLILATLIALWFIIRPEMCSPTRPAANGTGATFQAVFYGGKPSTAELLALQGPIVDLCLYDSQYRGTMLCSTALALFNAAGPGNLWACPCSVAGQRLRFGQLQRQFDGWYQLTCQGE